MTQDAIKQRLLTNFPDANVLVTDLTGGGDHWEVEIESAQFLEKSRIQQHQLVMQAFQAELQTGEVHALAIRTKVKSSNKN